MLAYRSDEHEVDVADALSALAAGARRLASAARPAHAAVVELLIDAGALEAAIADARWPDTDDADASDEILRRATDALARALLLSWDRMDSAPALAEAASALSAAASLALPCRATIRTPEGFAYYGLYPETYLAAAREWLSRERPPSVMVIGIRSIGTTLSSVVAEASRQAGASVASCTVRPRGHPFHRRLRLAPGLRRLLEEHAARRGWFAVVDEGPGLSGSSFASVTDALELAGAPAERVALFPSWDPEPRGLTSERARLAWARHRAFVGDFDQIWVRSGRLFGALQDGQLEDLSAGEWRRRLFLDERDWPAVQPQHERRKLLVTAERRPMLHRFAGLGRTGREAFGRAHRLAAAQLVPEVGELRDGFLAQRWLEGTPAEPWRAGRALLTQVATHVAHLRRHEPGRRPVPWGELEEMVRVNVLEALGDDWAGRAAAVLSRHERAARRERTTAVDGRLQPHEWIWTGRRYVKADALDHHDDHFLTGDQDAAWDVAGAIVELGLDRRRAGRLITEYVRLSGDRTIGARLDAYLVAYLAFRVGYASLAARGVAGSDDAARLQRLGALYAAMLRRTLFRLTSGDEAVPHWLAGIRVVVFDADQTLRRTLAPGQPCPHGPAEWALLPDVASRLAQLPWSASLELGAASNQDHVGYGHLTRALAHRLLTEMLVAATGHVPPRAAVQCCPHRLEVDCHCRKPGGAMLERVARVFAVPPSAMLFVGDAPTDAAAARAARVPFMHRDAFFTALSGAASGAPSSAGSMST